MTDRHIGYIVTLADDIREDDSQAIINALYLIKSVIDVRPVEVDHALVMARIQVHFDVRTKVYDALRDVLKP